MNDLARITAELSELLEQYAEPGAVSDTALAEWVTSLAATLHAYKRTGDSQMKTHNKRIHKEALAAINKELQAAEILIDSEFMDQETRGRVGDFLRETEARKAKIIERYKKASTILDSTKRFPKATRHDLCIFIIAAWKAIKNTDEIPGREGERNSENSQALASEFFSFLDNVLAPLKDCDTSVDELHRQVVLLERLEQESKQPKTAGADEKNRKTSPPSLSNPPSPK